MFKIKRMRITVILFGIMLLNVAALAQKVSIIPRPVQVIESQGSFILSHQSDIVMMGDPQQLLPLAEQVKNELSLYLIKPPDIVRSSNPKAGSVVFILDPSDTIGIEGYWLAITAKGIVIRSAGVAGLFYGFQSLRQMLPLPGAAKQKGISLAFVEITDRPRFQWRGMHLDVSRHFMPKEFILKYIDFLAMHKMNTFHWHLTDDQGWRIEIKKYPLLTSIGGWRKGTAIGHNSSKPRIYDNKPYGGFYTQEEIREIVSYAVARHVTIVPEIEMPGHAQAAIAAYPWLGCRDTTIEVRMEWGISRYIFNVSDTTFRFLEDVLTEVMDLFPSRYIHIGGDEAVKDQWRASAGIQTKIKALGLKDEDELQSWFIRRIESFLNAHGRRLIGWDEITEGGLAPDATVMVWRGTAAAWSATNEKHQVIMCPGSHCYFDNYQGFIDDEPLAIGGFTTTEKVYSFDPVPDYMAEENAKRIIGAQGNVWTEYILTPSQVEYMIFPRMTALSEVLWSPRHTRSWVNFVPRLKVMMDRYKAMKINYRSTGICR